MDICASYYALTDEQVMKYKELDKPALLETLNNLPYDKNFVSIGELWEGMHYMINGYGRDPIYNSLAPDDMKIAIYSAFFGGEWLKERRFVIEEESEYYIGMALYDTMLYFPENYIKYLKSDGFVFLSIIKYAQNKPNLLLRIVQSLTTINKNIDRMFEKYPNFEAFFRMRPTGLYAYYWNEADYDILSQHIRNAFSRLTVFYENALKNRRSVLVVIGADKDVKNSIDNCSVKEMK